jgi:hypothetical protein
MRKTFTFIAFACLGLGINAQIVRTELPDVGDSQLYRRADTTGVVEGAAGTGQAWDFSSLVATSSIATNAYGLPSAHPQGSGFPSANMAITFANGNYEFYETSANSFYLIGEKSPANTRLTYTDGAYWFRFPQAFGIANEDSVEGTYPDGFISSVTRRGWISSTFDAEGSLITPFATYPSAKRVEYLAIHHDSSWTGAANVDVFVKRYEWYVPSQKAPVLVINRQQVILNNGNPSNRKEVLWADPNAVAIAPSIAAQFEIFPNPSQGVAHLNYVLDAADEVRIEVLNILGERVRIVTEGQQAAGMHSYQLGDGLTNGIYLVRMLTSKGATTQKMILN